MKTQDGKNRYNNLDGLRVFAAIGIICMHVKVNGGFKIPSGGISDYIINTFIGHMGIMVQLFFVLSGFSMCCGYYEKIKNNQIDLNKFYSRRYERILPFFALLVFIDLVYGFIFNGGIISDSVYEAFADLTLMFGFYTPWGMDVIGVAWALGTIFGFYILFPFFVFLIWSKKRAWFSLIITCIIYVSCCIYFDTNPYLAFSWMSYFVIGGILYLYRDSISRLFIGRKWFGAVVCVLGFVIAFVIPQLLYSENGLSFLQGTFSGLLIELLTELAGFSLMLFGALCPETRLFYNPVSKFISKISLEIYLAHMLFFRIIEKINLKEIFGGGVFSYIVVCIGTVCGALIFASVYKYFEEKVKNKINKTQKA